MSGFETRKDRAARVAEAARLASALASQAYWQGYNVSRDRQASEIAARERERLQAVIDDALWEYDRGE